MRLVLFGPPGAGKGTQATVLQAEFGLETISTGNLIRTAIRENTALGQKAASIVNRGGLVPDDVVRDLANEAIARLRFDRFILDGYPRTIQQAIWLESFLEAYKSPLTRVISLRVPDDRIVERLSARSVHRLTGASYHATTNPPPADVDPSDIVQRDDDRAESVLARLKTYHRETYPVAEWYAERGLLSEIDGVGTLPEVSDRILEVLQPQESAVTV